MKNILIFGSSGTIGQNTLKVIRKHKDQFKIKGLCVNHNIDNIYSQIKEFEPSYVCVVNEKKAKELKSKIGNGIKLFYGRAGLEDFSSLSSDISVMAISGVSCLRPLMRNIKHTKRIALANKESIVTAGSFVFKEARRFGVEILPVDSEINAAFQLFQKTQDFNKVYLTASGGSLFNCKKKDLAKVSIKQVLAHPTWKMGSRITIDSATFINKGFEIIEAHHFFSLPYKNIDVVIQKESMIHALVELKDKTILACLYPPDMCVPISFALHYPQRVPVSNKPAFKNKFCLNFEPLDSSNFRLLEIIRSAAKKEDNSLAILNACDEVAVDYFLMKRIKFMDIYKVMQALYCTYPRHKISSVEDVFYWDSWARHKTIKYLEEL
jgi:1-deoxy-D-xylulose-5-phosphate reductoisomerase